MRGCIERDGAAWIPRNRGPRTAGKRHDQTQLGVIVQPWFWQEKCRTAGPSIEGRGKSGFLQLC